MNFFKSILSDEPEPLKSESPHDSDSDSPRNASRGGLNKNDFAPKPDQESFNPNPSADDTSGGWSFGGLIKTIATRSESVIETYRRDLQEFGSGLRNETDILREVASRAVKDLPASLEAGASAAHGSLESVSHAIDGVLKSTAEIISKESLVFTSDVESETPETNQILNSGRYSWFDSQLSVIQKDVNTFTQEPDDAGEYEEWKLRFALGEKKGEVEKLVGNNGALEGVYKRVVPSAVDSQTFWYRYFYRVDKLKQQEKVRANIVKRANLVDDEEELSWDVDEDDDSSHGSEEKNGVKMKGVGESGKTESGDRTSTPLEKQEESSMRLRDDKVGSDSKADNAGDKNGAGELNNKSREDVSSVEKVKSEDIALVKNDQEMTSKEGVKEKNDEKMVKSDARVEVEEKGEKVESSKKSDASAEKNDEKMVKSDAKVEVEEKGEKVESSKKSDASAKVDEEDLGWDEIEDIGSGDEKKIPGTHVGSPNRAELRKRLSAAEDDEDLNWDIEDDDEPVKTKA